MLDNIEKAVVFYHKADFDGVCSAAILYWSPALDALNGKNLVFVPSDYPADTVWEENKHLVDKDTTVIIVDFSLGPNVMPGLRDIAKEVIWCDHHISAIRDSKELGYDDMLGSRSEKYAGCELTWTFFNPSIPMPDAVRMLGRYDVWDHSQQACVHFQYGMREAIPVMDYMDILWEDLLGSQSPLSYHEIMDRGETLYGYQRSQNARVAKSSCYELEFQGYKAIAIHRSHINMQFFDSVFDESRHDMVMAIGFNGESAKISMYTSKDIDLSVLAKKFGGGGHAKACGFELTKDKFISILQDTDGRRYNARN